MHTTSLFRLLAFLILSTLALSTEPASAQRLRRTSDVVRGRSERRASRARPRAPRAQERRVWRGPAFHRRWAPLIVTGPYVAIDDDADVERFLRITIAGEGQYVLDGIGRGGLALRVGLPVPIELHAGHGIYVEPREGGADAIGLGRVGLAWRLVEEREVQARVGLALRLFHDAEGVAAGLEGFGGIDAMPIEPLVVSVDGGVGVVGEVWVLCARGTLGLAAGPVEVYAGWEHVVFEPLEAGEGTWLGGPLLGVRGWL